MTKIEKLTEESKSMYQNINNDMTNAPNENK